MDQKRQDFSSLERFALDNGMCLFGVADFRRYDKQLLLSLRAVEGLHYAISIGVRLSARVLEDIETEPTRLYSWHYRQANIQLDKVAFQLANVIQSRDYQALPIAASQTVDWQKQQGHLSHKHIGVLAGHGWIGRNNLLVNSLYGSAVRYATILTDLPLPVGEPVEFQCGSCRECIEACPVRALGDTPENYNFDKCFQKLTYFCKQRNLGLYICGICVKVCRGRSNGSGKLNL